jgi:DNA-binding NarL/FixJ family response regulator
MVEQLHSAREACIAVVDDHDVVHTGVCAWCAQADPPIRIAGNYFTVDELLTDYPARTTEIDAVLLDLELESRRPRFDALDRVASAGHRIIVYSHIEHAEVVLECLNRGASTYLVKSEGKNHLLEAIYSACDDTPYIGPRMAAAMVHDANAGRPKLSAREKEVLTAWFQTESKSLVAQRFCVSTSTVQTHLQRARAKYAAVGRPATTKSALVARAIQDGIISVEDL